MMTALKNDCFHEGGSHKQRICKNFEVAKCSKTALDGPLAVFFSQHDHFNSVTMIIFDLLEHHDQPGFPISTFASNE